LEDDDILVTINADFVRNNPVRPKKTLFKFSDYWLVGKYSISIMSLKEAKRTFLTP
jgi:hypothetical protein